MTPRLSLITFCWPNQTLFSQCLSAVHHHMLTPSQEGLWWTEGSCSGVSIITKVAN